jgi:surface antigen
LVGQKSTVTVQSAFVDRHGQTCRIVEQTVIIAGEKVKASGTMCLQPDGRWALVP